jgi:DNA-binding response OmpR family regulator
MAAPMRALVVEDDETINALVTLTMEAHGFAVVSACDGPGTRTPAHA